VGGPAVSAMTPFTFGRIRDVRPLILLSFYNPYDESVAPLERFLDAAKAYFMDNVGQ
jgi:hypothetical protein